MNGAPEEMTLAKQLLGKSKISVSWEVADVQAVAELDDKQCEQVLATVERRHDAEVGINWAVIEMTADMLYPGCLKEN